MIVLPSLLHEVSFFEFSLAIKGVTGIRLSPLNLPKKIVRWGRKKRKGGGREAGRRG